MSGALGPLKKAYGREIEHLIRRSILYISKTQFFPAFYDAFQAAITKENIKGGFRGAGLVPFDPEYVVSKLDVQLRTPTPAEEVTNPSSPWVSTRVGTTTSTPLWGQVEWMYDF